MKDENCLEKLQEFCYRIFDLFYSDLWVILF